MQRLAQFAWSVGQISQIVGNLAQFFFMASRPSTGSSALIRTHSGTLLAACDEVQLVMQAVTIYMYMWPPGRISTFVAPGSAGRVGVRRPVPPADVSLGFHDHPAQFFAPCIHG